MPPSIRKYENNVEKVPLEIEPSGNYAAAVRGGESR
jgi:hypothetical protein